MNLKPHHPDNLVNYHEAWINKLLNLNKMTPLHTQTVSIAESCVDQLKEIMPGCQVRVIIETPYMEAHNSPERGANGNGGAFYMTKHEFSELSYVTINTEQ